MDEEINKWKETETDSYEKEWDDELEKCKKQKWKNQNY